MTACNGPFPGQRYRETARIDGCRDWQILSKILLPLLKAPITVVGVFAFIDYWSSFLWPLIVVNDSTLATIPLGLQMFSGERGTDWGPLMAAVTMTTIPSILLVVFLQKQLERASPWAPSGDGDERGTS